MNKNNMQIIEEIESKRMFTMSGDVAIGKIDYKFTIGVNYTDAPRPFFTGSIYRAVKQLAPNKVDVVFVSVPGTAKKISWDISKYRLPIVYGVKTTEYESVAKQILSTLSDMPKDTVEVFRKHYFNSTLFEPVSINEPTAKEEAAVEKVNPKSFSTTEVLESLYPLLEKLFVPRSELTKEVLAIIAKHESKMSKKTFKEIKEDIEKLDGTMPEVETPIEEPIVFTPKEEKKEPIVKDEIHPKLVGKKAIEYTREDIKLLRVKDFDKFLKSITVYLPNKDVVNATKLDLEEALFKYITKAKAALKAKYNVAPKVEPKIEKPLVDPDSIKVPNMKNYITPPSIMEELTVDFDGSMEDEFTFDEEECSLDGLYGDDMPTPVDLAIDKKKYNMSDAMAKLQNKHLGSEKE